MCGFFNKNEDRKLIDELTRTVQAQELKITELNLKFDNLEQLFKSLRALVNRKLGREEDNSSDSKQQKDLYGLNPFK